MYVNRNNILFKSMYISLILSIVGAPVIITLPELKIIAITFSVEQGLYLRPGNVS